VLTHRFSWTGRGSGSVDGEVGDRSVAEGEALLQVGDAAGEVAFQADGDDPYIVAFLPDTGYFGGVGVLG
jgi:hypothetical protein